MKKLKILIVLPLILFLAGCTQENHIHVMGFDEDTTYLATHHGLAKYSNGKSQIFGEDIDFMSFVVSSDGTFYAAGHSPTEGEIGIRKSEDGGVTWIPLAYDGLDFHNMAVSNSEPSTIYAWSTPPRHFLAISRDSGNSWTEANTSYVGRSFFVMTADHQMPGVVYVGSLYGFFFSDDHGESWAVLGSLEKVSVVAIADDPVNDGTMYVSVAKRGVLRTENDGETWEELNEGLPGVVEDIVVILAVSPSSELYAVTKSEALFKHDGNAWIEE